HRLSLHDALPIFAVGYVSLCGNGAHAAAGRPRRRVHSGAQSFAHRADEGPQSRVTGLARTVGHTSEDALNPSNGLAGSWATTLLDRKSTRLNSSHGLGHKR